MKCKIQTRRTTIRDFNLKDIDTFMEYRNDLEWMRYQGFKGMTRENYERELLGNHSLDAGKQYAITDTVTGELIGDVYLKREQEIYWIGYTVHPRFQQQGFGKEAVVGVIEWTREQGGTCIKAAVLPENTPSIRLLESLNFSYLTEEAGELVYVSDLHCEDITQKNARPS